MDAVQSTRSYRVAWQVVLLLCAVTTASSAQSTSARLFGTIVDAQGAVVPGAAVWVQNLATQQQRSATSDDAGRFSLLGLAPGSYELRIEFPGLGTSPRTITLTIAQEMRIDAVLQPAVFERVSVSGATSVVEASRTTLGHTTVRDEIDRLPVAGRDFASLALLTPGILPNQAGNAAASSGIVSGGQTGRNNEFLLDGASLDDTFQANVRGGVPLDAVREFVVLTDGYVAQYGQATGAIVSVVTRSGTNEHSAGVSYLRRDDRLDADSPAVRLVASPSGRQPVPFQQHIPAFSIGGPIQRDRAFYFGALEGTIIDTASVTTSPFLTIYRPGVSPVTPRHSSRWQGFSRVDVPFGVDQLATHYRIDQTEAPWPIGGQVSPESEYNYFIRDQDVDVTHRRPRSIIGENEFSSQIARRYWAFDRANYCTPPCPAFSELRSSITLGVASNAGQSVTETYWQVRDQFSMTRASRFGEHVITAGGNAMIVRGRFDGVTNRDGTFRFDTDTPFNPADPSTYPVLYTRIQGTPLVTIGHLLTAAFAQDRWMPTDGVTVNAGLRWDYDNLVGVSQDWNNLAPRLGIAFTPSRSRRTVFRGNYGVYFDQSFEVVVRMYRQAEQTSQLSVTNPGYPDVSVPLPNSVQAVPKVQSDARRLADLETPNVQRATAGLQQSLGSFLLSIDGVWGRGRNLLETFDANAPDGSGTRPDPKYQAIRVVESGGHSWYRGLYVGMTKRYAHVYSLSTAYTWSSAQRDTEDYNFTPQDQRNPASERGPAASDVRHQLVGSGAARLPLSAQIGMLVTIRSGAPYNVITGKDRNSDGTINDRPDGVTRNAARGAGFFQLDARLVKSFAMSRTRIEISAEAFNLTNHANWSGYDGNQKNPATFGRPTTSGIGRQIQLGAHLKF